MSAPFPSPWCPLLHFLPGKALGFKAELLVKSIGIGLHPKLCSCGAVPTPKTEVSRETGPGASSSRVEPQVSGMSPRCCSVATSVNDARDLRESVLHGPRTHHLPAQVTPQGGSLCASVQPRSKHLSWALQKLTSGEKPFLCHLKPPWQSKKENPAVLPQWYPTEGSSQALSNSSPPSLPAPHREQLCSRMRCLPRQGAPMLPVQADCQPDNRAPGSLPSPPAQTSAEPVGRASAEV